MVRTAVELEDGPGRASAPAVLEALARERHALTGLDAGSADGEAGLVHKYSHTLVRLSARPGVDLDYVPRCRYRHRSLNTVEPLAWPNFQRRGCRSRPDTQQQDTAQAAPHRPPVRKLHAHTDPSLAKRLC